MNLLPLRDAALDALALVLPVECAGCGAPDRALCAGCHSALAPDPTRRRLADGTPVFAGLDYDGVARAAILAFKEHGRTELIRPLVLALAAAVREAAESVDLAGVEVAAVPSSRQARRRRGFDPVPALVARAGLERARVFAAARPHSAQKSLSLAERNMNLHGVFVVRAAVTGRRFLLVDDVVTTGATLAAAASALRVAGAEVVAAAVVASTARRQVSPDGPDGKRPVTFS